MEKEGKPLHFFLVHLCQSKRIYYSPTISRVAPDQDLAGYPANFFDGYPVRAGYQDPAGYLAKKNTKKSFYLNFELLITR